MLKDEARSGLTILESSVYGTPLPLPGRGGQARTLQRIPPPGVCNRLLTQAAKVGVRWRGSLAGWGW